MAAPSGTGGAPIAVTDGSGAADVRRASNRPNLRRPGPGLSMTTLGFNGGSGQAEPAFPSQVEGLLKTERHALGVGPLQLRIAQVRAYLAEAVAAAARLNPLPRNARPVKKRLRDAVQHSCPAPVARIAGQEG